MTACHHALLFVPCILLTRVPITNGPFNVLFSLCSSLFFRVPCFPPLYPPFVLRRFPLRSFSVLRYPRTFLYFFRCICFALSHFCFLTSSCCVLVLFSFATVGCSSGGFVFIVLSSVGSVFCRWASVRAFLCWCFSPLSSLVLCVMACYGCVLGFIS